MLAGAVHFFALLHGIINGTPTAMQKNELHPILAILFTEQMKIGYTTHYLCTFWLSRLRRQKDQTKSPGEPQKGRGDAATQANGDDDDAGFRVELRQW